MTDQNPPARSPQELKRDPAALAQEVLRQLAGAGLAPTPEAYQRLYNELSGGPSPAEAEGVLPKLARRLAKTSTDLGFKLATQLENKEWSTFSDEIVKLVEANTPRKESHSPFSNFAQGVDRTQAWRDLLQRTLLYTMPALLKAEENLARESERLGRLVKHADSSQDIFECTKEVKSLFFHVSQYAEDHATKQMYFIRLLYMMMESVKEGLNPSSWLIDEINGFQQLIREPLNQKRMTEAILHLREVVFKNRRD